MNGQRFDAITMAVGAAATRRGILRTSTALLAALAVGRRGMTALGAEDPWPCPDGVDGYNRHCLCECASFGHSAIDCRNACMECRGHVNPVCPNPDERGNPVGPPVCCADRKPCAFVCGDKPESEPVEDLL
jgi:hypothetical protein